MLSGKGEAGTCGKVGRHKTKTSPRHVVYQEASLEQSDTTRLDRLAALLSTALSRNLGQDQPARPKLRPGR